MTELILKNRINRKKLNSIVIFLKSWGIDAEIKPIRTQKNENIEEPFSQSFGMWENRDINIRAIRQKVYERRIKSSDNDSL